MFDISELNFDDDLWSTIENGKDYFKEELYKEINKNHILYGIEVQELGRRENCDDVLFFLLDGTNRYAVVHLTWSQKIESDSCYPKTRIYINLADLINAEKY